MSYEKQKKSKNANTYYTYLHRVQYLKNLIDFFRMSDVNDDKDEDEGVGGVEDQQ